MIWRLWVALCVLSAPAPAAEKPALHLGWKDDYLTIGDPNLPGGEMRIHYLEAYCRPGSTNRKWEQTVIGHRTKLIAANADGTKLRLQCTLNDGVVVDHEITSTADEVDFRITATNPTAGESQAHWAQPCIRLDRFTGRDKDTYLRKCFIFLNGSLTRMPTPDWATKALYVPGQVWCPKGVDRNDVNPRPLSDDVPSNGLIGCYSADEKMLMAVAFEPYQELFQGVAACLHSDFRIAGLKPGENKKIRGKIYILPAEVDQLLKRYRHDFPEQAAAGSRAVEG
jgi:hypothetical protein